MNIQAIETYYKGYRFRSRLEARWAVFFDAVGIEWRYEAEGYRLKERSYLPDFFLPKSDTFVEIKPTEEAARESIPLMKELVAGTSKRGMIIGGSPNEHDVHIVFDVGLFGWGNGQTFAQKSDWKRCILCSGIGVGKCGCTPSARIVEKCGIFTGGRVSHALGEAQRARFEHGENGAPKPYSRNFPTVNVYAAGSVIVDAVQTSEDGEEWTSAEVVAWREGLFGRERQHRRGISIGERFNYGGPTILEDHGQATPGLAEDCIREVKKSDVMFVWIDTTETIGTLIEIGVAYADRKPIFMAFASEELARHFYFADSLSSVSVVCPDFHDAWKYFKNWQDNYPSRK